MVLSFFMEVEGFRARRALPCAEGPSPKQDRRQVMIKLNGKRSDVSIYFAAVVFIGVSACSNIPRSGGYGGAGGEGGPGAATGAGGSGGQGGAGAPSQAAWTVSFADTGLDCFHASHIASVGDVGENEKAAVVVDGMDGAKVSCNVSGSGSFKVYGSALQQDKSLLVQINELSASATEDSPASGTIVYSSVTTVDAYTSESGACIFYFVPGTDEGVAPGKVWAAFKCPKITTEGSICGIQQGYLFFESCALQ
jgi:hypothetical protein